VRGAALGWLAGVVVAAPVGWVWGKARKGRGERREGSRWRRAARAGFTMLAVGPVVLWLTMAVPGGALRRAMGAGRGAGDARPNLILITIDALRADHLGAYGSTRGLTPNLDAFAGEATRYEAAYVSSPWTLTSLGAVFTSLAPSQCVLDAPKSATAPERVVVYEMRGDVPLLSEDLEREGYATAAELTNHLLSKERGWDRGFECFRNESAEEKASPKSASDPASAERVTEHTWEWLRLNRGEPFFLWVHYLDPHVPYDSPDTPAELRAQYPRAWVASRRTWMEVMRYQKEPARSGYMEFCRRMYAEEVKHADRWVGELLKRIKGAGLYDRSLIVITADHGEELFDRIGKGEESLDRGDGGMEHGHTMHELVLRVPLLVRWPKSTEAEKRITQTVGLADLHDTLLEYAGVQATGTKGSRGLPRRDGEGGREVFSEWIYYGKEQTAFTTDDYKVIYHPDAKGSGSRFEVYDRRRDRREQNNLAGTPAAGELRRRLQEVTLEMLGTRRLAAERGGRRLPAISEKAKRDLKSLGYME
jgi:arylsulfatase